MLKGFFGRFCLSEQDSSIHSSIYSSIILILVSFKFLPQAQQRWLSPLPKVDSLLNFNPKFSHLPARYSSIIEFTDTLFLGICIYRHDQFGHVHMCN